MPNIIFEPHGLNVVESPPKIQLLANCRLEGVEPEVVFDVIGYDLDCTLGGHYFKLPFPGIQSVLNVAKANVPFKQYLPITPAILNDIEKHRKNTFIPFNISGVALIRTDARLFYWTITSNNIFQKITLEQWNEILKKMGVGTLYLCEIKLPDIQVWTDEMEECLKYVDRAKSQLRQNPAMVFPELRKAFNKLREISNDPTFISEIDKDNTGTPLKSKRLSDLITKARVYSHMGPHEDEGFTLHFQDAELLLMVTLGIASKVSEVLGALQSTD